MLALLLLKLGPACRAVLAELGLPVHDVDRWIAISSGFQLCYIHHR